MKCNAQVVSTGQMCPNLADCRVVLSCPADHLNEEFLCRNCRAAHYPLWCGNCWDNGHPYVKVQIVEGIKL